MGCASSKGDSTNESEFAISCEPTAQNELSPGVASRQPTESGTILVGHSVFNANSTGLSVLLVFPKPDKQTKILVDATEKLDYHCSLMLLNYAALSNLDKIQAGQKATSWLEQIQLPRPVDLVIIDRRRGITHSSSSNNLTQAADRLRQAISNRPEFHHAVITALLPLRSSDKLNSIITSTYEAGFNKFMFEFGSSEEAERELTAFAHNELLLIRKCRETESRVCNQKYNDSGQVTRVSYKQSPNLPIVSSADVRTEHAVAQSNQIHAHFSDDVTTDALSSIPDHDGKMRAYVSVRRHRGPSRSIPSSTSDAFDQRIIQNLLNSRSQDAVMRFHSLNATSPLCKVIAILNSSKTRSSNLVAKELQKAIDIICKSDVFVNEVFRPANQQKDPLAADLMEGLMVNVEHEENKKRFPRSASTGSTLRLSIADSIPGIRLTEEIESCLQNDDQWDYDILALEKVTQKRPLRYLAMKVFNRFNVCGVLRISEAMMMTWLMVIEENYHMDNPYHNATHAADVMQSTAYLMRRELLTLVLDSMDEVAMLLAAVVHDLNHPGRTNPFLVNSNNPLAILYNDTAVLESHHVALTFELTRKDPNINIFKNLSREEYRTIRGYMIDLVLATEMARHFEHVSKFINNVSKPLLQKSRSHDQSSVGSMSSVESGSVGTNNESSNSQIVTSNTDEVLSPIDHLSDTENRTIVKRMIIKCSDVNNPTRPLALCKEWADRIAEEYFSQTEEEKRLGLPIVMPNFDRQTCNIPKSQISFIDFFIKHMFSAFASVFSIPELMENLNSNYEYWENLTDNQAKPEEITDEKQNSSQAT
ncbi:Phosphodiesterase [Fasciolopsis buskii]|uniref:Phosphodiesterase n=1 Tax=Fasciolopsis buskii TaxID=27845 RepID=A0A8E0VGC8_9TREM|nr:Phosphodiesterase [Fasciolopsis buski]